MVYACGKATWPLGVQVTHLDLMWRLAVKGRLSNSSLHRHLQNRLGSKAAGAQVLAAIVVINKAVGVILATISKCMLTTSPECPLEQGVNLPPMGHTKEDHRCPELTK